MAIRDDIHALREYVVGHRRWFHMHPELDFRVPMTQKYIVDELTSLKLDRVDLFAEGVRGVISVENSESTLAFRADMDALELQEQTDLAYKSTIPGRMHACGHDGHMAMLLGLARWAAKYRSKLKHSLVFIFQPAEESVGGALPMIEEGVLEDPKVDAIFAFHIFPQIDQGKIGIKSGPLMAQTTEFDIELKGRTAHGAMPHQGVDAIVAASNLIIGLQTLIARRVDPMDHAVITIGSLMAGERRNILAERAVLEGTIRTFDDNVYMELRKDIIDMIRGIELSYGVSGEFKELVYYPVVNNHSGLMERLSHILRDSNLVSTSPLMIAEDFSYFQRNIPGSLMLLGSRNVEKGYIHPLHSNEFNFDEEILLIGIQAFADIILKF